MQRSYEKMRRSTFTRKPKILRVKSRMKNATIVSDLKRLDLKTSKQIISLFSPLQESEFSQLQGAVFGHPWNSQG